MATGVPTRRLAELGSDLVKRINAKRPVASQEFLNFAGHDSWIFQQWNIDDPETLAQAKTLFLQEMLRRGVLLLNTHDVTTAFADADLEVVSTAYSEALTEVCDGMSNNNLRERLECEPIRPLFRVRA
jgi:glutamate-1-semialdehyde 2,1-aminomutase